MRTTLILIALLAATEAQAEPVDVAVMLARARAAAATPSLNDLWEQAVKESRPLCIWVGYRCPSSSDQVPGMLHHHTDKYKDEKGPCVVVLVPGGDGKLYRGEVVSAEKCCASELRAAVERTLERWQRVSSSPAPMMRPAPAVTFQHVRGWAMSRNGACVG
jgi:hypothetical protein